MNHVNRRQFVRHSTLAGIGAFALSLLPTRLMAQSFQKTIPLPRRPLQTHVLNRTGFGFNQEMIDNYNLLGYKQYIEFQLNDETIDDSELEEFIATTFPTINKSVIEIRQEIRGDTLSKNQVANELVAATFFRALYSKKQLREVMVEFWNNHFNVYHRDGPVVYLKTQEDRDVIRPLALSTFSEILHASAKSPAMIYYLDTYASTKDAPNENYARELMELHTLGVDGPYTHHDIDEIARCFTGWKINNRTGQFRFVAPQHDSDEKVVLGQTIAANGGVSDGEKVLDILANDDSTAHFLAKKLCIHFISDTPDISIIDSTAKVFKNSGGDIKKCLRHIFLSKNFILAHDTKLKRPFHQLVSVLKSLNVETNNRRSYKTLKSALISLGNIPFDWQTPDGYPDTAGHWESTTGMLFRWNFTNLLCFDQLPGFRYNLEELIQLPHTPENIYQQISEKVLGRKMYSDDEMHLLEYLTDAVIDGNVPTQSIKGALAIVLSSPYFQLI